MHNLTLLTRTNKVVRERYVINALNNSKLLVLEDAVKIAIL